MKYYYYCCYYYYYYYYYCRPLPQTTHLSWILHVVWCCCFSNIPSTLTPTLFFRLYAMASLAVNGDYVVTSDCSGGEASVDTSSLANFWHVDALGFFFFISNYLPNIQRNGCHSIPMDKNESTWTANVTRMMASATWKSIENWLNKVSCALGLSLYSFYDKFRCISRT